MATTRYLSISQAATELGCTPRRIQELVQTGRLPRYVSHADRRRVLIPAGAVERLKEPMPLPNRRRVRAGAASAA